MPTPERDHSADQLLEDLDREVQRVADRLRTLELSRLGRPPGDGTPSPAEAAREVCRRLEELAAQVQGRAPRPVPALADAAAGDQVAVVGGELAAALRSQEGEVDASVAAAALEALVELRRRL